MSQPSVAKDKTSNKVSLVTRPNVKLIPSSQVIGSRASQPTLIYVQSVQPPPVQPAYFSNKVNKQPTPQPVSIISSRTFQRPIISKIVPRPSTSSLPYRVETVQLKGPIVTSTPHTTQTILNPVITATRTVVNNNPSTISIAKVTTTQSISTKLIPIERTPPAPIATINNKSTALNIIKVDPIKYRYRTILEHLLQLKNNFIKRTITQAIQEKLCNQSNEDLLNVIFKSFELTLLSVNTEQIYSNETYLNATLAFLAKVIETGRFMELIENRKETKDIRKFVTAEMSTILNMVSLESVYQNSRGIFEQKQRGSYAQMLELLTKAVGCVNVSNETKMKANEIEFWFTEVMPLIFDADDDIQTNAIKAFSKAMPLLLASRHQSHSLWPQIRVSIVNEFTQKIIACFKQNNPKWYMIWCLSVRLLDIDIPRSASTLNAFLTIVEPALRSTVPMRRAEGYLCWRVLLEVLVRHNRLNSEKRLKLMCTPLKSLQAKTIEIATNKFQAWWYVICNVQENVENYISMVFEPFLQFCFGQMFPTPNLRLRKNETATQVKSFVDVSWMAISTFLRILDESDKQIDDMFAKFSLIHPSHAILSETIFRIQSTAALVINACGEATVMMYNLRNDVNNTNDCITLAVCMWTRLFRHINRAKNVEHINLVLENITQLQLSLRNPDSTQMIPIVCNSIINHIESSFIFEPTENSILTHDSITIIAKLMKVMILSPNMQSRLDVWLSKLLAVPQNEHQFEQNFNHLLTEVYEQFFKDNEPPDSTSDYLDNKFTICCEFINSILSYMQANADHIKQMLSKNAEFPQVFYDILYWPLLLALNKTEFDVYTQMLLKAIDLLLTVISNANFCKCSAKTVKNIITSPVHCTYINDTVATLFNYMVYDFDELKDAPIEMLNLCALATKNESKVIFLDLNSITEALIKYRRAIGQKQFEIVAPKIRDVIKLIDAGKANLAHSRVEPGLIQDLKELVGDDEPKVEKMPHALQPTSKSLRSTKNRVEKDEFVVVNKVWKLEPSKLTEHQREKMKTRRCDIPALYNDLSQSQDSVSIQEWAPKIAPKVIDSPKLVDEKMALNDTSETTNEISQRGKRSEKGAKISPKRLNESQNSSQNDTIDRKDDKDMSDDSQKRRMTRELNRIQIDAKIEEVPYSNLPDSNRLTRSTVKKIEENPENERRKTRSDSTKITEPKFDTKKKTTRTSLANSPVPIKPKTKANVKPSGHSEPSEGEPTPKRRLTRQSRTDESDHDESIQKVETKKTEFVDTLELRVEKLPIELQSKYSDKSEVEVNTESDTETVQQEHATTEMDVDEPTGKNPLEPANEMVVDASKEAPAEEQPTNTNMEVEVNEVQQNAQQVLVETQTVPNSVEIPIVEAAPTEPVEMDVAAAAVEENENNVSSRSYMSALVFDGISPSKNLNGSSIVTSPEINGPRSLEFLNDTLNISPIISDDGGNNKKEEVTTNLVKKMVNDIMLEGIERIPEPISTKQDHDLKVDKPIVADDTANDREPSNKIESQTEVNKSTINASTITDSPIVSSSKQLKTAAVMQSSTPLQSHHSPVSSKFKTPLMGRGAQLLKMINSNKSPKPASPTPASAVENVFTAMSKIASPAINQLETAPICENIMNTPESKAAKDRLSEKHEQNENGNFLTLSGALPSPFESPGISILKRKSVNISMDDSMHSPAPKRKRVSFGFPLSQTKEYIIDEDFTPFYMIPSNDSPCRRANRLKKLKLKRNKNQNDSAKKLANDIHKKTEQPTNDSNATTTFESTATTATTATTTTSQAKDKEVSVKHIQDYLGMHSETNKEKPDKQLLPDENLTTTSTPDAANHSNSDDSSTESNDDDPEFESVAAAAPPPIAKSIKEFSDDEIFAHLKLKYSANDILKKFDTVADAKALAKRLSMLMSSDKSIESAVLEELAEKHSESFLEHAITENLCSVICDRLSVKSPTGFNTYITDKMNSDDQFASDFLDRVSVSVLRQKLMDIVTTSKREQHILLDDFLTALKDYISSTHRISPRTVDTGILPEHIHLWVSKLFDQFKLTAEQYLQLTSIYIQKNPPATLDSFD